MIHLFRGVGGGERQARSDDERPYEERHIAITIECSTEIEILTGHRRARGERTERTAPTRAQTRIYMYVYIYIYIRSYVIHRLVYIHARIHSDNLFSMMRIVYLYPSTSNRFMTTDNIRIYQGKEEEGGREKEICGK